MPRKPRFDLPGVPVHVVQRGNNRQPVFFADEDRRAYLRWLGEAAARCGCAIHAYVLMTNHIHLLTTPGQAGAVGRMIQTVGQHYVPYVNRTRHRSGTLWEGRYKACLIEADRHLLACQRYIELNPVRAGLVAAPGDYPWSSYAANARGRVDPLVHPHPLYEALGDTPVVRRRAYRAVLSKALPPDHDEAMRHALQSGTPLGGEAFRGRVEAELNRPIGHIRRGRPRKSGDGEGDPQAGTG